MRLLIIADDVTGAADCAARCFGAGLSAALNLHRIPPTGQGATAYTSDSRHLPPGEAAQQVHALIQTLGRVDGIWYKKIDSTLRGNLGSELDAVLHALGKRHAVVAPAFPAQGRGLQHGLLRSALVQSPLHLPTMLGEQSGRAVTAIDLDVVRGGVAQLAEQLVQAAQRSDLLVADAMTDADLHMIARATDQALPEAVLCGSAGLIGAIAADVGEHGNSRQHVADPAARRAALIVVGSGSVIAHRQIGHVQAKQQVSVIELGQELPEQLGDTVVLHLPLPAAGISLDNEAARQWAMRLTELGCSLIERLQPGLLILVGGDTAGEMLARLDLAQLRVIAELLPGMPLTEGVDGQGRLQRVVLKAGNHGDDAALHMLLQRARQVLEYEVDDA